MRERARFEELLALYLDEELEGAELAELRGMLEARPELRKEWAQWFQFHRMLGVLHGGGRGDAFVRSTLERLPISDAEFSPRVVERLRRGEGAGRKERGVWGWVKRVAAPLVAGVLLGGLGASVVWAYNGPRITGRVLSEGELGFQGFEELRGEVPRGFRAEVGKWSGDPAQVLPVDLGGGKPGAVLRFLRTASDQPGQPSNSCDVFQIVDLRKAQAERMGGDSVVEFSARFADRREPGGARVEMGCQIYFFLEEPDAIVSIWPSQVQDVESFVGIHKEIPRCADAFRWKRISARALLPPEAQYAVIQLSAMRSDGLPLEEKELGQQYADSPTFTVTSYGPRTGPVPVGNGRKR